KELYSCSSLELNLSRYAQVIFEDAPKIGIPGAEHVRVDVVIDAVDLLGRKVSAERILLFIERDLEAPLRQLQRGREACEPGPDDGHVRGAGGRGGLRFRGLCSFGHVGHPCEGG